MTMTGRVKELSMAWRTTLVTGAVCLFSSQARADDTIMWLLPDFAPAALPVDGKPSYGIVDQMVLYLSANWVKSEHTFMFANAKRIWTMLGSDIKACHAGALVTKERRKIAYFTLTNLAPPLQLVIREDKFGTLKLNAEGEVNLKQLFANQSLRGILVEQRSFGEAIDGAIRSRAAASGLAVIAPNNYGGNILKLLSMGQGDYTIEYDFAVGYQLSQNRALANLRTVPIEGSSALMPVGIACPRTAWGRATIEHIDQIVGTRAGAEAMYKAAAAWSTPAARAHYGKEIDRFTESRMHPANPADF